MEQLVYILHRIKAWLFPNHFSEDPNDFVARASAERSLSTKEVCESAVSRGRSDISAGAMLHAVDLFFNEMSFQLCDGYTVNTGFFSAGVHIKGVYHSPNEHFDPAKHSISFDFRQGHLLRKEIPSIEVQIMGVAESGAAIMQVIDMKTGSVNDVITPDRNLRILGQKIKLAGDAVEVGIYFVDVQSQGRHKVDATEIVTNTPSEVMIIVPPGLADGDYQLELTTMYSQTGASLLKEPRTAVFHKVLNVGGTPGGNSPFE